LSETVACPSCGAANPAPAGDAPFFCGGCKSIIDRQGRRKRAAFVADAVDERMPPAPDPGAGAVETSDYFQVAAPVAPRADSKVAAATPGRASHPVPKPTMSPDPQWSSSEPAAMHTASGDLPSSYVSRYGTKLPQTVTGPGARFSVGGSMFVGLSLCTALGVIAGLALGWVSANVAAVPLVFAFAIGWLIKRALAAGSGGGTPDRGVVGGTFLFLAVVASFGAFLFAGYLHDEAAATDLFRATYATTPAIALAEPEATMRALHARDSEHDGAIVLPDGNVVRLDEAEKQLTLAAATGKVAADGYDVQLLAACGTPGFRGHLKMMVTDGTRVRLVARSSGIEIPGFGVVLLWLAEFSVLLLTAVGRLD